MDSASREIERNFLIKFLKIDFENFRIIFESNFLKISARKGATKNKKGYPDWGSLFAVFSLFITD